MNFFFAIQKKFFFIESKSINKKTIFCRGEGRGGEGLEKVIFLLSIQIKKMGGGGGELVCMCMGGWIKWVFFNPNLKYNYFFCFCLGGGMRGAR